MEHGEQVPDGGGRWLLPSVLLIASAFHMPRAQGLFRQAGVLLETYPVAYRTTGTTSDFSWSTSWLAGFEPLDRAALEWVGLTVLRLTGKTDALVPAP